VRQGLPGREGFGVVVSGILDRRRRPHCWRAHFNPRSALRARSDCLAKWGGWLTPVMGARLWADETVTAPRGSSGFPTNLYELKSAADRTVAPEAFHSPSVFAEPTGDARSARVRGSLGPVLQRIQGAASRSR